MVSAFIYNVCTLCNILLTVTLEAGLFIIPISWRSLLKVEGVKSLPRAILRAGGSLYPKFTGVLGREPLSKRSGALRRLSVLGRWPWY